jgi:ABC-2 type transport system ATP-binding protein
MTENNGLQLIDLCKSFGKVKAVNKINLTILKGQCFGLLGPNGAGKTTLIEMIEGLIKPDSGQILYLNKPIDQNFKYQAGIQFQYTKLQDFLTVKDNLKFYQALYPKNKPLDEIVEICQLRNFLHQDTNTLSGGQRQRLYLALALINDPEIIFLDEPSLGLDPHARRDFWQAIQNIKNQDKTVVLTTHYLEEAEFLCDEIAIMMQGKIIAEGSPQALVSQHFGQVGVSIPRADMPSPEAFGLMQWEEEGDEYVFYDNNPENIIKKLIEHQVSLKHLSIQRKSLNDVFLKLTFDDALRIS